MKNLILTMMAVAFSFGVFAQETTPPQKPVPTTQQETQKKDVFVKKDNKMWQIKDGNKTELTEDTTLANGTIVSANGTVKTTDGESVALKDGQYVDTEGNIGDWKEDSDQ